MYFHNPFSAGLLNFHSHLHKRVLFIDFKLSIPSPPYLILVLIVFHETKRQSFPLIELPPSHKSLLLNCFILFLTLTGSMYMDIQYMGMALSTALLFSFCLWMECESIIPWRFV
jgi:hypothetical protein